MIKSPVRDFVSKIPNRCVLHWLGVASTTFWLAVAPSLGAQLSDTAAKLTAVERAYVATKAYATVTTYFAHWRGLANYDFDREFRSYLAESMGQPDRRSFDLITMALFASLKNGHTEFHDAWLARRDGLALPFRAEYGDSGWVVTFSSIVELRVGSIITKLDGQDFDSFFSSTERYIPGSNRRWRRRELFRLPYLFPAHFTIDLADGSRVAVDRAVSGQLQPRPSTRMQNIADITYIQIPSFVEQRYEDSAVAMLGRAIRSPAVIIDIRGNHGGSTPLRLIRLLMNRPWRSWVETTPQTIALFKFYHELAELQDSTRSEYDKGYFAAAGDVFGNAQLTWGGQYEKPLPVAYNGRLLLLVDGGCFSACEDFVVSFKDNLRAVIVGDTTGGSSGQEVQEAIGNGMTIGVSTKREFFPDGAPFEGIGIGPDVRVVPTPSALRHGDDPVFRRAMEIAKGTANPRGQ